MRLSDLQSKKIINITDGKSIGNIIDVYVVERYSSYLFESRCDDEKTRFIGFIFDNDSLCS